jgi:hypothetical protein
VTKVSLTTLSIIALIGHANAGYNYCYTARDGVVIYDRPPYTVKDRIYPANSAGLPLKRARCFRYTKNTNGGFTSTTKQANNPERPVKKLHLELLRQVGFLRVISQDAIDR